MHESRAAAVVAVVVVAFVGDCMSHFPFNQQQHYGTRSCPAAALMVMMLVILQQLCGGIIAIFAVLAP